jgi:predicted MFS family arabinose efflux permease
MATQQPFTPDTTILLMHLVRAAVISIMSGFLAAFIANENRKTPLILGVLLLAFGLMVQVMAWSYLPIWYHLIFLAMLIPFTILGGKIKQTA